MPMPMPSPFPGMDPYLEHPGRWPDVHLNIIAQMRTMLNIGLRPRYVARAEERVYVEDEDDSFRSSMIPDVRLSMGTTKGILGASAAAIDDPVEVKTIQFDEITESRLEVTDVETSQLVAVIEVLSPSNKTMGSSGRDSFRKKRNEVLQSKVHWIEIDLLRRGKGFIRSSLLRDRQYYVHVSRANRRPLGKLWRIDLRKPLPTFGVPLRGKDPDFPVNLQEGLDAVYHGGSYDVTIDYKSEPIPPLPADLAAWADQLLKEKGLR
jgi:hypothetical protein